MINIQQLIKFKQENKIKICQKLECAYYFRFFFSKQVLAMKPNSKQHSPVCLRKCFHITTLL